MTTLQRMLSPFRLAQLGLIVSLAACASSGSGSRTETASVLVTLHDYKTGQTLELASEAHTNRVEYYSNTRTNAVRKVQTDEVMSAFVEQLDKLGMAKHSQPGRAPSIEAGQSADVIRWGFDVERGEQRSHWLVGTGSAADDWKAFQECRDTFVQLYNITVSFQAVKNESGGAFFGDDKTRPAAGKKK